MSNQQEEKHWESRAERRARKRLERKQGKPPKKFSKRLMIFVLAGAVIAGAWFIIPNLAKAPKPADTSNKHRQLVDSCTTDAATTYHIHPHLRIIINDKETGIPTDVGVSPNCLHPIHTHDATGIIHVESPKKEDFTLGDFFYVWEKDYSSTKILDQEVTAESQLKLFADGKEITTGPDTVVQDKTSYVIMYGPTGTELKPPDNYNKFPE